MVVRDIHKDQKHWKDYLPYRQHLISISEKVIKRSDVTDRHRASAYFNLFMHRLEVLVSLYSIGEALPKLEDFFPSVVKSLDDYLNLAPSPFKSRGLENYIQGLWVASFAVLLEVSPTEQQRVANLVTYAGSDALIDHLRQALDPSVQPSTKLRFPDIYQPLLDVFSVPPAQQQNLLHGYLKRYYSTLRPTYWYNYHLSPKRMFFGYWAIEAAAVVKLTGVDDTPLLDNVYYPRDLIRER